MIGVVNASPLIFLGIIGALDLLPQLFTRIITTDLVRREVLQSKHAPEKITLESTFSSWIEIQNPQNNILIKKFEDLRMHQGEASVLVLAKELINEKKEPVVIIDDLTAREIARTLGISVIGTGGILLRAVRKRNITPEEGKRFLRTLIEKTKFRISIQLYLRFLTEIEKLENEPF